MERWEAPADFRPTHVESARNLANFLSWLENTLQVTHKGNGTGLYIGRRGELVHHPGNWREGREVRIQAHGFERPNYKTWHIVESASLHFR